MEETRSRFCHSTLLLACYFLRLVKKERWGVGGWAKTETTVCTAIAVFGKWRPDDADDFYGTQVTVIREVQNFMLTSAR